MDYTELKKLAESMKSEGVEWFALDERGWSIASDAYDAQAYIAAASPDVVLGMIAEIESLKAYAMHERSLGAEPYAMKLHELEQERDAALARVTELEGQNSELRVCISDVLATGAFSENAQLRFKRLLGADRPVPVKTLQGVNDMDYTEPKATSLSELLRSCPAGYRLRIKTPNSLGFDEKNIPIGKHCHEAADAIEALQAQVTNEHINCAMADESVRILQARVTELESERDFYKRRVELLRQWQSKMRDPERTIACDIIANGQTLPPEIAGNRYNVPDAIEALQARVTELENLTTGMATRSDAMVQTAYTERDAALARVIELESDLAERTKLHHECIDDLKEALAKLAELEKQAPVAWVNSSNLISAEIDRKRYPGGHGDQYTWRGFKNDYGNTPLYASPVPAKTLSEPEIRAMWRNATIEICSHENCYVRGAIDAQTYIKGGA